MKKTKKEKPKRGQTFSPFYQGPDVYDKPANSDESIKMTRSGFVKE